MSYMLRDRPDGQVEIVLSKPILVGVFPERDIAQRVCAFLRDAAIEWPEDEPAGFATASADVADAEAEDLDLVAETVAPKARRARAKADINLPAVIDEKPRPPVFLTISAPNLTEDQKETAFRRIAEGEKIAVVAQGIGITMSVLRGMWANHKRGLQKHIAEGGKIACCGCKKLFMPSISSPDTCARCSHG